MTCLFSIEHGSDDVAINAVGSNQQFGADRDTGVNKTLLLLSCKLTLLLT
jgi:hypothetical protein